MAFEWPVDEFFVLKADGGWADAATYRNAAGTEKVIPVLFDDAGTETMIGTERVVNSKPLVSCRTADVTDVTTAATFTLEHAVKGTVTYNVLEIFSDVQGVTRLVLTTDAV